MYQTEGDRPLILRKQFIKLVTLQLVLKFNVQSRHAVLITCYRIARHPTRKIAIITVRFR